MYRVKFVNKDGIVELMPVSGVLEGQRIALRRGACVYRVYHYGSVVYELTHSLRSE